MRERDGESTLTALLRAEAILQESPSSPLHLYEIVHRAAIEIGNPDAFYVCLYDQISSSLHFVFNVDRKEFATPESYALGDGPTSRVIRTGEPCTFVDGDYTELGDWQTWGSDKDFTRSGLHLPVRDRSLGVIAVISPQWYDDRGFSPGQRLAYEWLAKRVGAVLLEGYQGSIEERKTASRLAVFTKQINERLHEICAEMERNGEYAPVRPLLRRIRSLMVDMIQWNPEAAAEPGSQLPDLTLLSAREIEVLLLAAEGLTNTQISESLFISGDTVKRHLSNAFRKSNIRSRKQAARMYDYLSKEKMTRSGH